MRASYLFIYLYTVTLLALLLGAQAACPSATYVDSFSSLPSAPVFPSSTLASNLNPVISSSNPLTQNHWSEKANLAAYRPPKIVPVANPTQTNCPHLQTGLKNWHNPATWGGAVPANGASFSLPENTAVLISSCSIDSSFVFGVITVPASSKLIFADAAISIQAVGFKVLGSLLAGTETCRLRNKITITLHGKRSNQVLPADPWIKGISVNNGTIDLHGAQYFPTWTRLAVTAKPGDSYVFIQDLVNWQPGQKIVITTTELKDSRDWHRNEERTIVSVKLTTLGSSVSAIQLDQPLQYRHFGGSEYQAEVSLLSRNIVVQGDATNSLPTDTANAVCKDANDGSTYPCENSYLTGFGAHIIVQGAGATGRLSGVELFRVGQTNVLGRYPIHFHMMGDQTSKNYQSALVQDSAVHDSYFRCFAIHGTQGAKLTQNTAYNAIGHCYFLEDGVEENNIISYNQAAHVHALGPYVNPSIMANNDNWYTQYLSTYTESSTLILPSDMAAGCFYFTNTYNDFFGNAASGGWAGFSIPSLQFPVKLHSYITNMSPANRPFRSPFRGNSAHSSGYWWATAGGIYVGGELSQPNGVLSYTSGRSRSRDTCSDKTSGTPAGEAGCWTVSEQLWLRFEDNKVFLSNRGLQNWGTRAEIIRFELHDVSLAMNIFGKVWIDSLLMECRSKNHRPTWFNGCPTIGNETKTPAWGKCNVRDYTFFNSFGGFQWYDVSQQHILTNSIFRNCREDWDSCVYGPSKGICSNVAVFTSLSHSDQFVPELMQVTSGISYQNVSKLWRYSTKLSGNGTVSGRLQSWYDVDGSASQRGVRSMIGSAWANEWWKYNSNCDIYEGAYRCPLATADSAASVVLKHNPTLEAQIGKTICMNGGGTCPVVGTVSHFGSKNESAGLYVGVNARLTGPLIASSGGWFVRFNAGTPKKLTLTNVQVDQNDVLLIALPYPAGTTFTIYHQGASWCGPSWAVCKHAVRSVGSIAEVRSSFGDAYYWNSATRTLYIRAVQTNPTFGSLGSDVPAWSTIPNPEPFSRGGHTLIYPSYQSYIIIESTCTTDPCAPQNDVPVPAALNTPVPTPKPTAAPTPKPTTAPTTKPTTAPTPKPTTAPTTKPTAAPTTKPTAAPTTKPTSAPTTKPTTAPTTKPTAAPTTKPTTAPTTKPTAAPTTKPTTAPTTKPTTAPTTKPTTAPTTKPTAAPTTKPAVTAGTGLKGQYYSGVSFNTLVSTRVDATVNFNWGASSPLTGVPVDNFSVRWSGFVLPTSTGLHTFYVGSDDGAQLWVNGQKIISNWISQSLATKSGSISLNAGVQYTIVLEYYEAAGQAAAILSWATPSSSTQTVIPQDRLFPAA